jgi:uncharacterized membrane protein
MALKYSIPSEMVMVLDNFRKKLRQEAQIWRDEGLLSSSQYQQIAQRYQFNELEIAARDRFTFIVIAVGSILLGSAVIIFVAANWQAWSREVKLMLLLSLFMATTITGFYTWREPTSSNPSERRQQRSKRLLGEGLLILGALILGANIAVMAQLFRISGSAAELFLCWGLGVVVMAYGLRLTSLGILSIILMQIGYWLGLREFLYSPGEVTWARLLMQHMPLVSWLLFVPLAYLCLSRWIFALSAIAFATSLQLNLNPLQLLSTAEIAPWVASFAFALPPSLWWSYDDMLFPTINYRLFQPLAQTLTVVFFSILFSALSFSTPWRDSAGDFNFFNTSNLVPKSLSFMDLGIFSGLVVLQWLYLLRHRNTPPRRGLDFNTVVICGFIVISALIPFWHQAISPIGQIAIFIFNLLLGILAFGLMRRGLELGERRSFWGGLLLLTLQIISRILEYESNLVFKSFVFAMCGIGVISAGLWFERRLNSLSNSSINR